MAKRDPHFKGYAAGHAPTTSPQIPLPLPDQTSDPVTSYEAIRRSTTCQALHQLLLRSDGWLRLVPQDDGKAVFCKWKWTRGAHRGYYVMTVGRPEEIGMLLHYLVEKVDEVGEGVRKPTLDKAYGVE